MRSFAVSAFTWFLVLAPVASAQQTNALKAAADALGATGVKTLEISGWGWGGNFVGQNFSPADPWPRVDVKSYTAQINYEAASMRVEMRREVGPVMPLGGGNLISGEQHSIELVSGSDAWNVPTEGPGASGVNPRAQPQPAAVVERMLALWATPHGFLRAAIANQATTRTVPGGTEVSFMVGGKHRMTGLINRQNQVERVQTWIDQPLAGDLLVETIYRVYRNFDGVLFPAQIVQNQGGFPMLELTVSSVRANPAVDIAVPAGVRGAQPPLVRVTSKALADGVYFFSGGGPNSLAVEMRDHIVLIEAPSSEARVLALIAKAKELIPNKPVRFVVNTHHHWDHSGGIRAAMDEGATIVTHEINRPFFERVARMPHTLVPDRLSVSKRAPKFQTIGEMEQLTDGSRTINLYAIPGFVHAVGMLMVYLPNEKILIQADAPGRLDDPPSPRLRQIRLAPANAIYDNILRRGLDVQTIVMLHSDEQMDMAEFAKALGRNRATPPK